jgi:hypothetical protein
MYTVVGFSGNTQAFSWAGGNSPLPVEWAVSAWAEVTSGTTYTVGTYIDATDVTTGTPQCALYDPSGTELVVFDQTAGSKGTVSASLTIPSGVTSCRMQVGPNGCTVSLGGSLIIAQPQLTQTSSVQGYEPGPLWYYNVYREDGTYGAIANVTALAIQDTGLTDTGMPPSTTNTSDPLISPPSAPSVTPEGVTGSTPYSYEVSAVTATFSPVVTFPIAAPLVFGTTSSSLTLTNNGNFYCSPIITFTGPLSVPSLAIGDETLTLDNNNSPTIASGETVTIDTHTHSVLLNVTGASQSASVRSWVTHDSSFPVLPPGSSTATFTVGSGSSGSVSIVYADAHWL